MCGELQEWTFRGAEKRFFAGRVHMEPFFATHLTIICNHFSLGYVEQTKSFLCYFLFVCVNLSPANLLQGGSRPASRGQNKYSTQG